MKKSNLFLAVICIVVLLLGAICYPLPGFTRDTGHYQAEEYNNVSGKKDENKQKNIKSESKKRKKKENKKNKHHSEKDDEKEKCKGDDLPLARPDTFVVDEDTVLVTTSVLVNDCEEADECHGDEKRHEEIELAITEFTLPAHGNLAKNGDSTFTYTPKTDFYGSDGFSYTITNDDGCSATGSVNITVIPVNDAPIAENGSFTTDEDTTVTTILTASDIENELLAYTLISAPENGTLNGSAPNLIYYPNLNYNGPDSFTFKVNDGQTDSQVAVVSITINPVNDAPVAENGSFATDEDTPVTIILTATDIENDPLAYTLISAPENGVLNGSPPNLIYSPNLNYNGPDSFTYAASDGAAESLPATVAITINPVNDSPVADVGADQTVTRTETVNLAGSGSSDVDVDALTYQWSFVSMPVGSKAVISEPAIISPIFVPDLAGAYRVRLVVSDGMVTDTAEVIVMATPLQVAVPDFAGLTRAKAEALVQSSGLVPGSVGGAYSDTVPLDKIISQNPAAGTIVEEYTPVDLAVSLGPQYIGDPDRLALITGQVDSITDHPVPDVSVRIHNHPEYGTVYTDASGRYSIPVMGGVTLQVVFEKQELITSQRAVDVPINHIVVSETLQLIAPDEAATTVTFDTNSSTTTVHQSTEVADGSGSRSATMVFQGDNRAYAFDKEGNVIQELTTITVRATEFTTLKSMPAPLPPDSAYTYCVELSVDGVKRVRFDKPIMTWVNNFRGFAAGDSIPVGYFDRDLGVWVSSDNGVVVRLLDTDGDSIVDALDADNDGLPDDLNGDGFFTDEVLGLDDPLRYAPDSTFWRIPVSHFTPYYTGAALSPVNPPSLQVHISPAVILPGQDTTITWSSANAETITIDNGIGPVGLSGSMLVSPVVTTTYILTAAGQGKTTDAAVTVGVMTGQQINPADPVDNSFGGQVAIDGDYAVVGADNDDEKAPRAGAAYVFKKTGTGWVQQEKLLASDGTRGDNFGQSVAINGDYIIVGASYDDDKGRYTGSAYIFKRVGESWIEQAKLTAGDAFYDGEFGDAVAINGDYVIIGAYYADDEIGAAYVFKREGSIWTEQAKLSPGDGEIYDYFGSAVAINGDFAMVGSPEDDDDTGGVYAFRRYGDIWVKNTKIRGSDTAVDDEFGYAISMHDDTMIVGAPYNSASVHYGGGAYIFRFNGTDWLEEEKLSLADAIEYDKFARSVAIYGNYALVGLYKRNSVYLYHYENNTWNNSITIAGPVSESYFGYPVAISQRDFITGTRGDGKAYIYDIPDVTVNLSAEPVYAPDGTATLIWDSFNADTCSIEPGIGQVAMTGSMSVSISETTTYTLDCHGPLGSDSGQVTVYFGNAPALAELTALPKYIQQGGLSTLIWGVENAATCVIQPGGFGCTVSGSQDVNPVTTTTYTLTAVNSDGVTTVAHTTIGVNAPAYTIVAPTSYSGDVDIDGQWALKGNLEPTVSVYRRGVSGWSEFSLLAAADAPDDLTFGESVALSGNRAAIGAPGQEAVYVFYWNGTEWLQEAKITAPGVTPGDEFGAGVDIDGDYLAVRSDFNDNVHVFHRAETGWQFQDELAGGVLSSNWFGADIAISGSYIVVGDDSSNRAYIFRRIGETWLRSDVLQPDCLYTSSFGVSVDIDGDTIIIGDDDSSCVEDWLGAAYVYKKNGSDWIQESMLLPGAIDYDLYFGENVRISGDYAVVGAWFYPTTLFQRKGVAWKETAWNLGSKVNNLSIKNNMIITSSWKKMEIYEIPVVLAEIHALPEFAPDGNTLLGWSSINADSCRIGPGIGEVGVTGSMQMSIENDTTYFLNCDGAFGSASDQVTFRYDHPPPEAGIMSDPEIIYIGDTSTLRWGTINADRITIDNGVATVTPTGSVDVDPAITTTYTLTAIGPGGAVTDAETIRVIDPQVTISADQSLIMEGKNTVLRWTTIDVDNGCIINPANIDCSYSSIGGRYVYPVADTTYTITGTDPLGGTVQDSLVIEVVIGSLQTDVPAITQGKTATLSWNTRHLDTCTIMPGNYDCSSGPGSVMVSPAGTTTYTLTGMSAIGPVSTTATITVYPPIKASLEADQLIFYHDGSGPPLPVTLTWKTANADQVTLGELTQNNAVEVALSGSAQYSIYHTKVFMLTAKNSLTREQLIKVVTVRVASPGDQPSVIFYPVEGDIINAHQTLVRGLVATAAGEMTVTVNGVPAQVFGSNFFANNVPLTEGANTLTVTATAPDGTSVTDTVNVTSDTITNGFMDIGVDSDYGMAPHTTTLRADVQLIPAADQYQLSYQTPEGATLTINTINAYEHELTFDLPGPYLVRYTVFDTAGGEHQQDVMVLIEDIGDLDSLLRIKWQRMKNALSVGDIEVAAQQFTRRQQDVFREIFTVARDQIVQMALDMQDIERVYVSNDTAEYRIQQDILLYGQAETVTFYIYFERDGDGIWRIRDF